MAKKALPYRTRLSALFVSFAILTMGTSSLLRSMSIDYYTVLNTLIKIIPASIVIGLLGWTMGMILDQPKKRSGLGYTSSFIGELASTCLSDASINEEEMLTTESTL